MIAAGFELDNDLGKLIKKYHGTVVHTQASSKKNIPPPLPELASWTYTQLCRRRFAAYYPIAAGGTRRRRSDSSSSASQGE